MTKMKLFDLVKMNNPKKLEKYFHEKVNTWVPFSKKKQISVSAINEWTNIDSDGNTCFHVACIYQKDVKLLKLMLQYGATSTLSILNNNGSNPFHMACKYQKDIQVFELLFEYSTPETFNIQNKFGLTCMHLIAESQKEADIFDFFLKKDGAVESFYNIFDTTGITPLHIAFQRQTNEEIFEVLFKYPPIVNNLLVLSLDGKYTPLHLACTSLKSRDVYYTMLQYYDKNVWSMQDIDNYTPFHYICKYCKDAGIIKLMLEHGAGKSWNLQNKFGNTPFHIVCEYEKTLSMFELMLQHGASVSWNIQNTQGNTPFHIACRFVCNSRIIKIMLKSGAVNTWNILNINNASPFHAACMYQSAKTLILMINYGARDTLQLLESTGKNPIELIPDGVVRNTLEKLYMTLPSIPEETYREFMQTFSEAVDIINFEDVDIKTYLKTKGNIVCATLDGKPLCLDYTSIKAMYKDVNNYWMYECIGKIVETKRNITQNGEEITLTIHDRIRGLHNYATNMPYIKFYISDTGTIGLVPAIQIFAILLSKSKLFFIKPHTITVHGNTEHQMLTHTIGHGLAYNKEGFNGVSANHCQHGTNMLVYDIYEYNSKLKFYKYRTSPARNTRSRNSPQPTSPQRDSRSSLKNSESRSLVTSDIVYGNWGGGRTNLFAKTNK